MNLTTKRRIVLTGLALLIAWIPTHFIVVSSLGLNPWRWFGWAMYTVPSPTCHTYAVSMQDGSQLDPMGLPPAARAPVLEEFEAFSMRRQEFGPRVEPDQFAAALFIAFAGVDDLVVQVQRLGLQRETATFERLDVQSYIYERN